MQYFSKVGHQGEQHSGCDSIIYPFYKGVTTIILFLIHSETARNNVQVLVQSHVNTLVEVSHSRDNPSKPLNTSVVRVRRNRCVRRGEARIITGYFVLNSTSICV